MPQGGPNDRLKATFRGELQDHMRSVEADLLALERTDDPAARAALYASLFRAVHSLKGAARVVGEAALETVCHRLEEVVQGLRDGHVALGPALLRVLLSAVDAIRGAANGEGQSQAALAALLARLAAIVAGDDRGHEAEDLGPAATPAASAGGGGFVRVPAAKLDELMSRSEQLLVARRRTERQDAMLSDLHDGLLAWQRRWPEIEQAIEWAGGGQATGGGADAERARRLQAMRRALSGYRSGQRRLAHDLRAFGDELAADRRAFDQAADALDGDVRRLRMFPFAAACEGLERAARDLAGRDGKDVQVVVGGADVELDRSVLEGLRDPLLHLVRNAVDHGVEPTEDRRRSGKPPTATISVTARLRGMQVEVEVADDGRGIDADAVLTAARAVGRNHGSGAPLDLIFEPGLSTAAAVTSISGRGVGLDVVKSRVNAMRGTVEVRSQKGEGASFRLTLPLTLTAIRAVLVSVAGRTFAVEAAHVQQLLRVETADVRPAEGRHVISHEGRPVVFASLAALLGLGSDRASAERGKTAAMLLAAAGRQVAFAVDELIAEGDVVVRHLGPRLKRVRHVAGATMLPDGRLALILNVPDLLDAALEGGDRRPHAPETPERTAALPRLLLADDSVTTRTLMKTILEGAGYEVTAVGDGAAAWRALQEGPRDLVVSDVEMPEMDGIALTEAIRASPSLRDVPVVLVTALESEQDRARGLHAGANAYLVKSAFDQRELLEIVGQLL